MLRQGKSLMDMNSLVKKTKLGVWSMESSYTNSNLPRQEDKCQTQDGAHGEMFWKPWTICDQKGDEGWESQGKTKWPSWRSQCWDFSSKVSDNLGSKG